MASRRERVSEKEDQQPDTTEVASPEESAASVSPPPTEKAVPPPATAEKPVSPPPPPPKSGGSRSSSFPGWLALLLVLALGGALAWVVTQALQREAALEQRLAEMQSGAAAVPELPDLGALEARLRSEFGKAAGDTQVLGEKLEVQSKQLQDLQGRFDWQAEVMQSLAASDEDSWLRAEAQYLLRLANQRILMARDPKSALALLQSADNILKELEDPGLYEVRAAIASEIAALRAVPPVDVEGIYLRLSALGEQATNLRIFQLPDADTFVEDSTGGDWQTRLQRGYEEAAHKLSQYVIVRRRDVPVQALMDPQWEGLVRQNLRMLLEQAQVALLTGNQALYEASLERARHWVGQFFDSDEVAARAMDREISELQELTVQVDLPDLSSSLRALDTAIRARAGQGGAG